ncbi:hypothetical protein [Rhizobium sp. 9140]|uniref:hypothetical protein n=1 Tax=Rhizobium sp. 9140 TaxID=1761900 RepID=UPI000AB57336|nr:hypothetical protein [Rhizobium sp. 9140]
MAIGKLFIGRRIRERRDANNATTLAGIDSVSAPQSVRVKAWLRLSRDFDLAKLARTTNVIGLAEVPDIARRLLEGRVQSCMGVDVNG